MQSEKHLSRSITSFSRAYDLHDCFISTRLLSRTAQEPSADSKADRGRLVAPSDDARSLAHYEGSSMARTESIPPDRLWLFSLRCHLTKVDAIETAAFTMQPRCLATGSERSHDSGSTTSSTRLYCGSVTREPET